MDGPTYSRRKADLVGLNHFSRQPSNCVIFNHQLLTPHRFPALPVYWAPEFAISLSGDTILSENTEFCEFHYVFQRGEFVWDSRHAAGTTGFQAAVCDLRATPFDWFDFSVLH